jgi:hypothetical protein
VALSGDGTTALIGAPGDEDPNGDGAGAAYVFARDGGGWTQRAKLLADDGDSNDFFGNSVALSGDGTTALIGAPNDEDPNGDLAGAAYVFDPGSTDDGTSGLARFDQNDTGQIGAQDVLNAISAYNSGDQIGGADVSARDVIDLIAAYNSGQSV